MKKLGVLSILLALIIVIGSCTKENRFVSRTAERVDVKIKRFDVDFIRVTKTNALKTVPALYRKYPEFFKLYVNSILDTAFTDTTAISDLICKFNKDVTFSKVNKKALETFQDVADIESVVSGAFTAIHQNFPEKKLPEIYFFVSGFNRPVMMNENLIAFGTDFYLGADYALYKGFSYEYMLPNMRRELMSVDIVSTTLFRMFAFNGDQDRLLDNMIFRGKILYMISVMMPDELPANIMGYTSDQWKWAEKYEKEIWSTMIDQKDLFTTDVMMIKKYLNDAPFTAPISSESPGRLGTWIGWRIVASYMDRNNSIDLKQLMDEKNAQKILENSGYRP